MAIVEMDIDVALSSRIVGKRLASKASQNWSGRMNPKDLPWNEAADLANITDTLAWCVGWLVAEVRRLQEYERLLRELNESTKPQG